MAYAGGSDNRNHSSCLPRGGATRSLMQRSHPIGYNSGHEAAILAGDAADLHADRWIGRKRLHVDPDECDGACELHRGGISWRSNTVPRSRSSTASSADGRRGTSENE